MRIFIFITFTLLLSGSIRAQNKLADKVYFGGGFGLSTGNNVTNVSLSPQVGYKITSRLSAGVGISYQYVNFKTVDATLSNYGWSLFSRFNITQQFFAYTEFENLQFEYFTTPSAEETVRLAYNSMLIGAGYTEVLSNRASFSISALYNVLYDAVDPIQPYNSPWQIRAGIGLGLF